MSDDGGSQFARCFLLHACGGVWNPLNRSQGSLASGKIDFALFFLDFSNTVGTMLSNYFTLRHVAFNLRSLLIGARLSEAFSQERNELVLHFTAASEHWVVIGCDPSRNFVYARSRYQRARRNFMSFFPELVGSTVTAVDVHPGDRVLGFRFDSNQALLFEAFGSMANVLQTGPQGSIVGAFLRPKETAGRCLEHYSSDALTAWSTEQEPVFSAEELRQRISTIGHVLLSAALKKAYPNFGSVLVKEILFRAQLSDRTTVAEILPYHLDSISSIVADLLGQLHGPPQPRIYFEDGNALLFSVIPLQHMETKECRTFDSLHEAIQTFLASSQKQSVVDRQRDALLQELRQRIQRSERSLRKMRDELSFSQQAAHNELLGKLLMASLSHVPRGATEFITENIFSPAREQVRIPLQPQLTPVQNAQRYFEKSKRAKQAQEEIANRLTQVHQQWQLLTELQAAVEHGKSGDSFRQVIEEKKADFERLGIRFTRNTEVSKETIPFRVFTVEGGFQVWVGKSSENNDALTLRFAKPNDLWFHARGASGSHVVLRTGTGKGEPSKRAIEQAAAIAAYYSKMKNARNVPVAVTYRKYVRKPKGAPAGTVQIEQEKILFVDPALPEGTKPTGQR
jgi:predicted ribosome quality control (RQC) complex YloA/Tae2 family protein